MMLIFIEVVSGEVILAALMFLYNYFDHEHIVDVQSSCYILFWKNCVGRIVLDIAIIRVTSSLHLLSRKFKGTFRENVTVVRSHCQQSWSWELRSVIWGHSSFTFVYNMPKIICWIVLEVTEIIVKLFNFINIIVQIIRWFVQ